MRYYPHYFYSIFEKSLLKIGEGRVELLSMDKRIEPIDESYRGLPDIPDDFFDYTVTGNQSVVIRESLLPEMIKMGINTVKSSIELFPPGMIGAFCLETIYHPINGFKVFMFKVGGIFWCLIISRTLMTLAIPAAGPK